MEQLGTDLLQLHVFARLKLQELGRLRCVCRAWCDAIGSEEFMKLWMGSGRPCSVLRVRPIGSLTILHTEVWYPGENDQAPTKTRLNPGPRGQKCVGIASSHGLVCGLLAPKAPKDSRLWKGVKDFVVGNPVTSSWKTLPPFRMPRVNEPTAIERVHLQVYPEQNHRYQLVVLFLVFDRNVSYYAGQYDSAIGEWRLAEPFCEGGLQHDGVCSVSGVWSLHDMDGGYLAAYHPASMSWSCHKHLVDPLAPTLPRLNRMFSMFHDPYASLSSTPCVVFGWRGKAILVSHDPKYLVLSELDEGRGVWKVVVSNRYRDLYSSYGDKFESALGLRVGSFVHAQVVGDWLIITRDFVGSSFCTNGIYTPIAYNLQVYHSPYPFGSVGIETTFTFFPSFTAQP